MEAPSSRICVSCLGTGEMGSEVGLESCPDCGGAGYLPSYDVLVDWRARDIERSHEARDSSAKSDIQWLAAELRRARAALLSVFTLANEGEDSEVKRAIRFAANRVLQIHPFEPPDAGPS